MKKITGFLFVTAILAIVSCTEHKEVKKQTTVTPVEKVVVKEEPSKPTSISVDKNGVQVQTKKVEVKVGQ